MPLQIRRGTDAERLAMTQPLAQGELLFVSTPGAERLYIGNGSTLGGIQITGYTNADAKDAAAASFTGGTHSGITFTYNTATDLISANVDLSNYQGTLRADAFKGSVFADDSTLLVDAVSGTIVGPVTGNITGNVTGNVTGVVTGTAGSSLIGTVTGNVTGDVTGYHTGDVKGSVFADDSTLLVDAVSGTIVGPVTGPVTGVVTGTAGSSLIGTVTGNLIGYHTGDVKGSVFADDSTLLVDAVSGTISATSITGNIFTNLIDSANSSAITFTPAVIFNSDVTVENELFANLIGNVIGNIQGNVATSTGSNLVDVSNQTFNGTSINLVDGGAVTSPGILSIIAANVLLPVIDPVLDAPGTSVFVQNNAGTHTAPLGLSRIRGTFATPTAVLNGDQIGRIVSAGHDGTGFVLSSSVDIVVDGAVSAGIIPSRIDISTSNSAGTRAVKASIKSSMVEFVVPPKLPVVANDAARTTLVSSPAKGMMIFMESGTTPAATNVAQVFDGSAWVNL